MGQRWARARAAAARATAARAYPEPKVEVPQWLKEKDKPPVDPDPTYDPNAQPSNEFLAAIRQFQINERVMLQRAANQQTAEAPQPNTDTQASEELHPLPSIRLRRRLPTQRTKMQRITDDNVSEVPGKLTKAQLLSMFDLRRKEGPEKWPAKYFAEKWEIPVSDIELVLKYHNSWILIMPSSAVPDQTSSHWWAYASYPPQQPRGGTNVGEA